MFRGLACADALRQEVFLLVNEGNFSYSELLEMELSEMHHYLELLADHDKAKADAYNKAFKK